MLLFGFTACLTLRSDDMEAVKRFKKLGIDISLADFHVSGRKIHYVKIGADTMPTIVFVHGSPGSWDAFEGFLQSNSLLSKFRMYSIDRPGFGYSDFRQALNLTAQSAIISPFLKSLRNGKEIYLVGHSLGGPMVALLALDNPDLISGIMILSGALDVQLESPEKWRRTLMLNPIKYLLPGALLPSNEELWYLKSDLKILGPRYKKIVCKVSIIHGDKDPLVDYKNLAFAAREFKKAINLDTLTIRGANHFIPWKHQDEIIAQLIKQVGGMK